MMLTIFLILDITIIASLAFVPYVTRKTELFGVSIPAKETDNSKLNEMRRQYRNIALIIGVILLVFQIVMGLQSGSETSHAIIFTVLIFAYLIEMFVVYIIFHKKMKAYKATQSWSQAGKEGGESVLVIDTSPMKKEVVSAVWLLIYPAIGAITAIIMKLIWPIVPEQFPMQVDFAGNVTNWADKSLSSVIAMLATQWSIFIVMAIVYFIIRNSKRQIDASAPDVSREQGSRFRYIISASMIWGGAAIGAIMGMMFIVMMLNTKSVFLMYLPIGLIIVVIILLVILYLRVGQGGSRIKVKDASYSDARNSDDDSYWKLGVFYFNKNDPSLFVEKRFGVGYTNNWAKPLSWLILIGIFAFMGVLVWVVGALT